MQCGSGKHIYEPLVLITLKFIGLSCTLNRSFSHAWCLTSCIGHWTNICSLSYEDLCNIKIMIIIAYKKSHLLIASLISSEKCVFGTVALMVMDTRLQIFAWNSKFYHWQQMLPWIDRSILCIFRKLSVKCPVLIPQFVGCFSK